MVAVVLLAMMALVGVVTLMAIPGPVGVRWGMSLLVIVVAMVAAMAVVLHGRSYRRRIEKNQRKLDANPKHLGAPPPKTGE